MIEKAKQKLTTDVEDVPDVLPPPKKKDVGEKLENKEKIIQISTLGVSTSKIMVLGRPRRNKVK